MTGYLHALVEDAAREAGCTVAQILGPTRQRHIARIRQIAMTRGLEAGFSSTQVGEVFRRDHTTVLYAAQRLSRQHPGQLKPEQRRRILERDGYRCSYCGTSRRPYLGVDHVLPRSRGGTDDDDNLVACCRSCNSSKRSKTPEEWLSVNG